MKRTVLMAALLAGALFAQGPGTGRGFGPGFGPGPRGPMSGATGEPGARAAGVPAALKTYLSLTDDQAQKLVDARRASAEANRPILEQIREKSQVLREEMQKDAPDAAKVGQLMVDIKALRTKLQDGRGQVNSAALAVLTDAQKALLPGLDQALKLGPAARQAAALGLIAAPEPPAGNADGLGMGRGMGAGLGRGMARGMRR